VRRKRAFIPSCDSQTRAAELKNVIEFRCRPTDQERFDGLVRPHFEALYRSARRMTRSEHDAEDLLQEVFIKAITWLDELEEIEFPRAWLMKVMYNTFVDQARKNQRSPMSIAMTADDASDPDRLPTTGDAPPKAADRELRIEQITRAMRHMNSEQCALIAMRDVEGLSIEELCRITGKPAGTVKAQLHRARAKLGRLLSNEAVIRPRLRVVGGQK